MKYPKLWNGSSAVGEALVRALQMTGVPFLSARTADGVYAGVMDGKAEVKQVKSDLPRGYIALPHNESAPDGWGLPRSEAQPYGVPGADPAEAHLTPLGTVTPHTLLRAGTIDWVGVAGLRVSFSPQGAVGRYFPFRIRRSSIDDSVQWVENFVPTTDVFVFGSTIKAPAPVVGAFAQKNKLFVMTQPAPYENVLYVSGGAISRAKRLARSGAPAEELSPGDWSEVLRVPCPAGEFRGVWHFNSSGTQGNTVVHEIDEGATENQGGVRAVVRHAHVVRAFVSLADDGVSAYTTVEIRERCGLRMPYEYHPEGEDTVPVAYHTHAVVAVSETTGLTTTTTYAHWDEPGDATALLQDRAHQIYVSLDKSWEGPVIENFVAAAVQAPGFVRSFPGVAWKAGNGKRGEEARGCEVAIAVETSTEIQHAAAGWYSYVLEGEDLVAIDYQGDEEVPITLHGSGSFREVRKEAPTLEASVSALSVLQGNVVAPSWYEGPLPEGEVDAFAISKAFSRTGARFYGDYAVEMRAGALIFDAVSVQAEGFGPFGVGLRYRAYRNTTTLATSAEPPLATVPANFTVRQVVALDARYDHALIKEYVFTLDHWTGVYNGFGGVDNLSATSVIRYICYAPAERILKVAVGEEFSGRLLDVDAHEYERFAQLTRGIAGVLRRSDGYACEVLTPAIFGQAELLGAAAWLETPAEKAFWTKPATPSGNWMASLGRGDALVSISDKHTQSTWLFKDGEQVPTDEKFARKLDSGGPRFTMPPVAPL